MNTLLFDLLRKTIPQRIAEDICSVQPITKETIGDPTRGWENIFTITYWGLQYEEKQYMMWDDDGGTCA